MNAEETVASLKGELAQLRACIEEQRIAIAEQRTVIAGQQEAIAALQRHTQPDAYDADEGSAPVTTTSRRGFLGAAALGAAAAAASVAAVGAVPTAHAATGAAMTLGQANDANAVTSLAPTTSTTPTTLLSVDNSASAPTANAAISATTSSAITGAVYGQDVGFGVGVVGQSTNGTGIRGLSTGGYGVEGRASASFDLAASGTGRIFQTLQAQIGHPLTGPTPKSGNPATSDWAGESIRDATGELWLCIFGGAPGTWVKVAHLAPGMSKGGAINYPSKPIRLLDTRSGATDANQIPGLKCSSAAPTTVQVGGLTYNTVTVPWLITGAIGNVTVLNASASGYIELAPQGSGFTGAANIAFAPGQLLSNAFNVGLNGGSMFQGQGASGSPPPASFDIIIGGSGTVSVDVIIDLFAFVS